MQPKGGIRHDHAANRWTCWDSRQRVTFTASQWFTTSLHERVIILILVKLRSHYPLSLSWVYAWDKLGKRKVSHVKNTHTHTHTHTHSPSPSHTHTHTHSHTHTHTTVISIDVGRPSFACWLVDVPLVTGWIFIPLPGRHSSTFVHHSIVDRPIPDSHPPHVFQLINNS